MANKNNKNGKSKLLFFEPNPEDNKIIANEDVSIYVELETTTKGRSIINLDNSTGIGNLINSGGENRVIKFVGGNKDYLSTDYTNATPLNAGKNSETLGIESISIDFDTAYTPLIKIKFIDIRGNAMFEAGDNSDYASFFNLPYPLFDLTVKGYYGKPVKYTLHLLKFNGKFNSSTGNFEIDAEFIGYTYAILTDLLVGYLRAVVETSEGKAIFNEIKSEYENKGIKIITIKEFLTNIESISDEFRKIGKGDDIKELNTIDKLIESLELIKSYKNNTVNIINEDLSYVNLSNGIICVDYKNNKKATRAIIDYERNIKELVDNPETGLNSYIDNNNLKIRTKELIKFIKIDKLVLGDFNDLLKESDTVTKIKKTGNYGPINTSDPKSYDNISIFISNIHDNLPTSLVNNKSINDKKLIVIDYRPVVNEITRIENELIKVQELTREKIGKNLTDIATKKLSFEPNIRNVFRILTIHCEVFLKTLEKVSTDAENSTDRYNVLKKIGGEFNIKSDDNNIYPWPEFRLNNNGYEETWIGSSGGINNESEQIKVNEIVFVEEVLEKLLDIAKDDVDYELGNDGDRIHYYPISPLDTKFTNLNTENPYHTALNGEDCKNNPEEATRCLLMRGFIGLGLTNTATPNHIIEAMGQLEAYNLFYAIKDNFTKNKADALLSQLNSGSSVNNKTNNVLKQWKNGVDNSLVNNPYGVKRPLFIEMGDNYVYTYITRDEYSHITGSYDEAYIPINGFFDGKPFIKEVNGVSVTKEWYEINDLDGTVAYVSNETGDESNQAHSNLSASDGGLSLRFVDGYDDDVSVPAYGSKFLNKYRSKIKESTISQNSLKISAYENGYVETLDFYGTNYNSPEFFKITYDVNTRNSRKLGESIIYDKINKNVDKEGSILSAFWSQPDFNDINMGGNYLALGNVKSDLSETYSANPYKPGQNNFNTLMSDNRLYDNFINKYGKQRELLGGLLGEAKILLDDKDISLNDDIKIYTPYIDFGVTKNGTTSAVSLFGSKLYYAQKSLQAKAYLYLHSFAWQGLIGDIKGQGGITERLDVSLFDLFDKDEDETFTIKGIFRTHGGFIKAPKLWCAFIGAILHRYQEGRWNEDILNFSYQNQNNETEYVFNKQDENTILPRYDEYLYSVKKVNSYGININLGLSNGEKYSTIDETILNLPPRVKLEFIEKFQDFVVNDFDELRKNLEIFDENALSGDFDGLWGILENKVYIDSDKRRNSLKKEDVYPLLNYLDYDFGKVYQSVIPTIEKNSDGTTHREFHLELKVDSSVTDTLNNLISSHEVILNGKPSIFKQGHVSDEDKLIKVNKDEFNTFLNNFYLKFDELVKDYESGGESETDDLERRVFNSIDNDLIKLNIYRSLGSIYNKWIAGTNDIFNQGGVSNKDKDISEYERGVRKPNLIDSFRFLDRAFNDLGDEFLINPIGLVKLIRGNYNQTFFDIVNKVLSTNNFNFIALPNFLNFNDEKQLKEMFTPYPYNDLTGDDYSVGPSFVCTYVGQTSVNLDLGSNSNFPDDGIVITDDGNGNLTGAPEDFMVGNDNPNDLKIPMVSVSYGRQNQSFFKDINLDQKEFTETAETLEIIDDISTSGDKRKPTYGSQSLFNVYQTRSYSAEIEMMGNAMIQPMMYFHLNNIPMFRGAYMILKVNHSIKPNNMLTKFKGVRVKHGRTKLADSSTLFMGIVDSIRSDGSYGIVKGEIYSGNLKNSITINNELENNEEYKFKGIIIEE